MLTQELCNERSGGDHIGLHFRGNTQPVENAMQRIADYVLPHFHK
ncbi:hypothetical protein [Alteromonas sp. ALT199]|nr:hypothetical protein [Alteromonas sp. ALT199]